MLDSTMNKKQDIYLLNEEKEKHLQNAWYKIMRFNNEDIKKNMFKTVQKIHNM
jgi:very-short-patch-repair endonuclease